MKLHSKQYRFWFYVELAAFERHVIFNLHSRLDFNRVNRANASSIVGNKVNLELAVVLADEEHIDEFETVVHEYLAEIRGNKQFLCSECETKCKTER